VPSEKARGDRFSFLASCCCGSSAELDSPLQAPLREQFARMWSNWVRWATSNPEQRRALAALDVSDDITPGSVSRRCAGRVRSVGCRERAALTEALVPHLPDGANVVFVCSGVES
jgi:hypothetical protein